MHPLLRELRPREKPLVIDLVRSAGVDVRDWARFKGGAAKAAVNPKYCYEWAFVQPGRVVVVNLWHESMQVEGGAVVNRMKLRGNGWNRTKSIWAARALRLDAALQVAGRESLPVRVIVLQGKRRKAGGLEASKVSSRLLDPVAWAVTHYDWRTTECVITRGALPSIIGATPGLDHDLDPKQELTAERIHRAFLRIQRKLSEPQMAMLRAHYYSPGRAASMQHLALSGGYNAYRSANLQYGLLCRLLSKELKFASPADNTYVLATVLGQSDENGHALWRMDDTVAKALEDLAWVSRGAQVASTQSEVDSEQDFADEPETVRMELRAARIGQGRFRSGVLARWNGCAVTGCRNLPILNASHIVPWKAATNSERRDPANGLLLTPNLDRLFDRYLITFLDNGRIRISVHLSPDSRSSLGLTGKEKLRKIAPRVMSYLKRHREEFERLEREWAAGS